MSWGPDGVKLIDSSRLDDDAAAMVCEVSETVTKDGGSIRVKLNDKGGALEKLGKHLGMFTERVVLYTPEQLEQMSDDELEALAAGKDVAGTP